VSGWVEVSCGRGPVGVAQHGVEGAGKVVGQRAASALPPAGAPRWRQQHQQQQQQQQQQVEGERGPQHPLEEGPRGGGALAPAAPGPGAGGEEHGAGLELLVTSETFRLAFNS